MVLYHFLHFTIHFWLPLSQQLYTRGHYCAMNSSTELLVWMSHYHVKRVKPRDWPSVFTTCVTQGALTQSSNSNSRAHKDSRKQDTLSLMSWTRMGALSKHTLTSLSATQLQLYCTRGIFCLHFLYRRTSLASAQNQPVEEWVRAVGSHGPGILGHRGGHRICAAVLIHTGRQLVP